MEQITREEIIDLLKAAACPSYCYNGAIVHGDPGGDIEQCQFCYERELAISALQAAEPVAYGLKSAVSGEWDGRTTVPLQDEGEHFSSALLPLFTHPCPPAKQHAKAQVPDGFAEKVARHALNAGDCPSQSQVVLLESIRRLLTASPAPVSKGDGCTCQGCGVVYTADLNIPDEWWEKIKPEGKAEGAGLLCPTCIMERLVEKGWGAGYLNPTSDHIGDGNEMDSPGEYVHLPVEPNPEHIAAIEWQIGPDGRTAGTAAGIYKAIVGVQSQQEDAER